MCTTFTTRFTHTFPLPHLERSRISTSCSISRNEKKKIPRPIYSTRIHREREARALLADKREPQNTETRIETISTATNTSNRHSFAMLDGPHVHGSIVFAPVLIALQLLFPLPSTAVRSNFDKPRGPFLFFDSTTRVSPPPHFQEFPISKRNFFTRIIHKI